MDDALRTLLAAGLANDGPVVFLTGAGISAESGIPTFRGPEGYWTVGSQNFHPQEMATRAAFQRMPDEVWRWYLYRRSICHGAAPNPAHRALAQAEEALGDRFLLITQNVDGLHLRAGNSLERTYQIHGNLDFVRCEHDDPPQTRPMPDAIDTAWDRDRPLDDATREALACCGDGDLLRPHVLWFDEAYDEDLYRFESSMRAAASAALLVVVGTSGQTNLPLQVGSLVARRGVPMVVINLEESPFTRFAAQSSAGHFWRASAGEAIPAVVEALQPGG